MPLPLIIPIAALVAGFSALRSRSNGIESDAMRSGDNGPGVEAWRHICQELAADLPTERILRWIKIESAGNECSIDATRKQQIADGWNPDAGVLQIYFETPDSVVNGATSKSLRINCIGTTQSRSRALTDSEMIEHLSPQIQWLRGAIASAQRQLDSVGAVWSESDRWAWYKFSSHGLPAVAKCMLPLVTQQLGRAPSGWSEFRATCETMDLQIVRDAAALPASNGCTACLKAHYLWQTAFHNAEEMRS